MTLLSSVFEMEDVYIGNFCLGLRDSIPNNLPLVGLKTAPTNKKPLRYCTVNRFQAQLQTPNNSCTRRIPCSFAVCRPQTLVAEAYSKYSLRLEPKSLSIRQLRSRYQNSELIYLRNFHRLYADIHQELEDQERGLMEF